MKLHRNRFREHKKYQDGLLKSKEELEQLHRDNGRNKIYYVLSFGAGSQSSHLLEEHIKGNIHYDYIIFSDTGAEPEFIHRQVLWWQARMKVKGCTTPFITTCHNSMHGGLEEMLLRYIWTDYQRFQMPLYFNKRTETGEVVKGGLMPRQCTGDFKIIPVQQAARRQIKKELGLGERQQIPRNIGIIMDIGFSEDEVKRVGSFVSHQSKYIYLSYPLIEWGLDTQASINWLAENKFPERRSRCYFCPFNCDFKDIGMDWYEIIEYEPLSFLKACWFDEHLRQVQSTGKKNMQSIPYFHHSRTPLNEVYADEYKRLSGTELVEDLMDWLDNWKQKFKEKYKVVV